MEDFKKTPMEVEGRFHRCFLIWHNLFSKKTCM